MKCSKCGFDYDSGVCPVCNSGGKVSSNSKFSWLKPNFRILTYFLLFIIFEILVNLYEESGMHAYYFIQSSMDFLIPIFTFSYYLVTYVEYFITLPLSFFLDSFQVFYFLPFFILSNLIYGYLLSCLIYNLAFDKVFRSKVFNFLKFDLKKIFNK